MPAAKQYCRYSDVANSEYPACVADLVRSLPLSDAAADQPPYAHLLHQLSGTRLADLRHRLAQHPAAVLVATFGRNPT